VLGKGLGSWYRLCDRIWSVFRLRLDGRLSYRLWRMLWVRLKGRLYLNYRDKLENTQWEFK